MRITVNDLNFSFAKTKKDVFERMFPRGAVVTAENAFQAAKERLSLRCAARQLMPDAIHSDFESQANRLLSDYFAATSDTLAELRRALASLHRDRLDEAIESHERNKRVCWDAYLRRLAEVFVDGIERARAA